MPEPGLVEQMLHLPAELALVADGEYRERLTRRKRRHPVEIRAQQGGQVHRHTDVREVLTWISRPLLSRKR
jgi:hypothetical protein